MMRFGKQVRESSELKSYDSQMGACSKTIVDELNELSRSLSNNRKVALMESTFVTEKQNVGGAFAKPQSHYIDHSKQGHVMSQYTPTTTNNHRINNVMNFDDLYKLKCPTPIPS